MSTRLAALVACLLGSGASAAPRLTLAEAIALYDSAKFVEARSGFESIIADPLAPDPDRDQARLYVATMQLTANDIPSARAQLRSVLANKPKEYFIDPVAFPPELIGLAAEVREAIERERSPTPPPVTAPVAAPVPAVVAPPPAPAASRPVPWVPLAAGAALAAGGGVFLSMAADRHNRLVNPDLPRLGAEGPAIRREGELYQTVGVAGLGLGLVGFGVAGYLFFAGSGDTGAVGVQLGARGGAITWTRTLP